MELQLSIQKENPSIDTTPVANNREVSLSVAKQTIVTRNEEVVSEEVIDIIFARLSKGEPGKSAYQAAVEAGYTLSEAEFNRDLATISELAGAVEDKVGKEEFNTLKEDVENITAEYKVQLDNLEQALDDKVDKVDGKQLSTEDFTTEYKEQLDTLIENGGNGSDGELRELFNLMFEYDESLNAIQAKLPLYSLGSITAKGQGASSGSGGGGTAYNRLDNWNDYGEGKEGYVLSAYLGYSLREQFLSTIDGFNTNIDSLISFKETFEKMFSLDTDNVIKAKLPLYSLGSITAKGKGVSSGSGGGGTAYDRLDSWADYTTDKAGYVLSAGLGWDLNTRISNKFDSANFTKANLKSTLGISDWALAAIKPSYAWSEITSRPTALSQFTDDVVDGKYLPLSGGTVIGSITASTFIGNLMGVLTTAEDIVFNTEKYADVTWSRGLVFRNNESEYGNICYIKASHKCINITHGAYNATLGLRILENGNILIGLTGDSGEKLQVNGNGKFSGALTANSFIGNLMGNADSATKLQTPRKLWGNDFDGTANVSGLMSVGNEFHIEHPTTGRQLGISPYWTILGYNNTTIGNPTYIDGRNVYIRYGNDEYASVFASSGNVGIGNTSPTERLDVSGNIKASGNINATSITINGVTITASNGSITVNGNVFATGSITAKKKSA